MPVLLHIDSSIRRTGSTSRELSAFFAQEWKAAHPGAGYVYRDLATDPVPHLTHGIREHLYDPAGGHHGETEQERELAARLIAEIREATTILIGVPMYNYNIPSTLKAWFDWIVVPRHQVIPGAGALLKGKQVVLTSARGGSNSMVPSREPRDHVEPYLRHVLASIGLDEDLTFVQAELTMAHVAPPLAQFIPAADKSKATAIETLRKLATV
ncbi:FMN-dependent NADH-azoreductase [Streptomyces sp. NPDC059894]|uniref:FMN-dependent NADH-azoreductase n=1 Tax=unclassified Streptomyces TaxID=2593676 RepID=UPI0036548DE2